MRSVVSLLTGLFSFGCVFKLISAGYGGYGGYGGLGAPGLGGFGYGGGLGLGFGLWGGYPGFGFPWLSPPLGYQINTGSLYGSPGIGFYNPGPGPNNGYLTFGSGGVSGTASAAGVSVRTAPVQGPPGVMTNKAGAHSAFSVPGAAGAENTPRGVASAPGALVALASGR